LSVVTCFPTTLFLFSVCTNFDIWDKLNWSVTSCQCACIICYYLTIC
jgi:hypothetical protein